jgi:MATE family multidrug resistance protein
LGRGDGHAAQRSAWLVLHFITIANVIMAIVFMPLKQYILDVATDDTSVLNMAVTLVPAMLVGTYLNVLVNNITSGVFSGMGRPLIATILSFGLELPLSIGGVAIYILWFHGNLLGVYWWMAISGGIEAAIVILIMASSNWSQCADEAKRRQAAAGEEDETNETDAATTTDPESSVGLMDGSEDGVSVSAADGSESTLGFEDARSI